MKKIACVILMSTCLWFQVQGEPKKTSSFGELIGLKAALTELSNMINGILNQVDASLQNRTEDIFNRSQVLIKELDENIAKHLEKINQMRSDLMMDINGLFYEAQELSILTSDIIAQKINETISNIAGILDKIPFVKIDPFVIGLSKVRVMPDISDRLIIVYGHFKKAKKITIDLKIGEMVKKEIAFEQSGGVYSKIQFFIPEEINLLDYQEKSIEIKTIMKYWPGLFRKKRTITSSNRIYIRNYTPYYFDVTVKMAKPTARIEIEPTIEFESHQNGTFERRTISANDMLSQLVSLPTIISSKLKRIAFIDMHWRLAHGGPCDSCTGNASFEAWNENFVTYSLSSECEGGHWKRWDWFCGGGCSHADIWMKPRFSIEYFQDPPPDESIPIPAQKVNSTYNLNYNNKDWGCIQVVTKYKDGDIKREETFYLSKNDQVPNVRYTYTRSFYDFTVNRMNGNNSTITINTRDLFAPNRQDVFPLVEVPERNYKNKLQKISISITVLNKNEGTTNPPPLDFANYILDKIDDPQNPNYNFEIEVIPNNGYELDYYLLDDERKTDNPPIKVPKNKDHSVIVIFKKPG